MTARTEPLIQTGTPYEKDGRWYVYAINLHENCACTGIGKTPGEALANGVRRAFSARHAYHDERELMRLRGEVL